jgi:hypothetical protein
MGLFEQIEKYFIESVSLSKFVNQDFSKTTI